MDKYALLFLVLRDAEYFTLDAASRRNLPRIFFSAALMAAALVGGVHFLEPYFRPGSALLHQVAALFVLLGGAALIYFLAAQLSGAADVRVLFRNLKRKPVE